MDARFSASENVKKIRQETRNRRLSRRVTWLDLTIVQLEFQLRTVSCKIAPQLTLTLVADRAVLCFVILHGHFEHIIAPDADTMNLQLFLATVLPRGLIMLRCVRLAHRKILTCPAGSATILDLNSGVYRKSERNSPLPCLLRQASNGSVTIL